MKTPSLSSLLSQNIDPNTMAKILTMVDSEMTLKFSQDELDVFYEKIYILIYGNHFSEEIATMAVADMENEDGTQGGKWSISDSLVIAKKYGATFANFNDADWFYVLNMMYSDYCTIFTDKEDMYAVLSMAYLYDKDGIEGKAFLQYLAIKG